MVVFIPTLPQRKERTSESVSIRGSFFKIFCTYKSEDGSRGLERTDITTSIKHWLQLDYHFSSGLYRKGISSRTRQMQPEPVQGKDNLPVCRSASSRFHPRPDFVSEALPGLFLFLLPFGIPCPQTQEAQHVHFVDFLHPPAVLHQFVVGGIDVFRQRCPSARCPRMCISHP